MKIDMHCHVHEGSIDSRVSLDEYITVLKEKGFDGMLITDHDSYHGYRHWKYEMKGKAHQDFVVLKGIEYDTLDAGHMLCIMPEGVRMRLLELKGLPVSMLIEFVHRHGGILGPAHPYGAKYMSMTNTKRYRKSQEFVKRFDFIEVFNACESQESNDSAARLAAEYGKPGVGGSDAHKTDCIGTGYTILPEMVTCETELINLIREIAAPGSDHLRAARLCVLRKDLRRRVGAGKNNRVAVHRFHHLRRHRARCGNADKNIRARQHIRQRARFFLQVRHLRHLFLDPVQTITTRVDSALAVAHGNIPEACRQQQLHDGNRRRARTGGHDLYVLFFLSDHLQRVHQTGKRDHRRAVLVVMEDRDITAFL